MTEFDEFRDDLEYYEFDDTPPSPKACQAFVDSVNFRINIQRIEAERRFRSWFRASIVLAKCKLKIEAALSQFAKQQQSTKENNKC